MRPDTLPLFSYVAAAAVSYYAPGARPLFFMAVSCNPHPMASLLRYNRQALYLTGRRAAFWAAGAKARTASFAARSRKGARGIISPKR